MNLRIPVPRPDERVEQEALPRGGVGEEELRRIEDRAGRFLADQVGAADAALARTEQHHEAVAFHVRDQFEARAIVARAQTLKAEGTTRLAVFLAAGAVAALVFGPFFAGGKNS